MKLYRAGITAGVLAAAVALAACSSSGGSKTTPPASPTASGSGSSSSTTGTGTGATPTCSTGTLTAAGSTAQANAVTAWTDAYSKACPGAKINYTASGSGAGVSGFNAGQDDFAGSDSALNPMASPSEVAAANKRCGSPALDLPMVVGPIAIAYKLAGVSKLILTPQLIAKIFTGKITKWNDPAIAAKNPGTKLPSTAINVVFRSDSSGTTANFEKFLAATDPTDFTAMPAKDNAATVFKGQGKSGSQGVASAVGATEGAIGYVEYSFAVNDSLNTASVDSGSGPVDVSKTSASAAIASATVKGNGNKGDLTLSINYSPKTAGAYPIVLATYEIVCTKYASAATGTFVKNFLTYTAGSGQALLAGLGYAPLPAALQTQVQASIATIS